MITPLVTASAVPERPSTFGGALLVERLAHSFDDVVLALEEAERAPSLGQVLDVAGHGVGEVVDLVDERRDEQGAASAGDREDAAMNTIATAAAHGARARASAATSTAGLSASREEDRDEDPDQDPRAAQTIWSSSSDAEDDPEHDEDRARTELHEALLKHRSEDRPRRGRYSSPS